jgi:hypothetical protein
MLAAVVTLHLMLTPGLLASGGATTTDDEAILVIERSGQCGSRRVTVFSSGYAAADAENTCGHPERTSSRLIRLPKAAVGRVQQALRDVRFFELPDHVEPITVVTDDDFLSLRAVLGKQQHTIVLQGEQLSGQGATVERFRAVWEAVEALVPEPRW